MVRNQADPFAANQIQLFGEEHLNAWDHGLLVCVTGRDKRHHKKG